MTFSTPHLYQTKQGGRGEVLGETKGDTAHGLTNLVVLTTLSRSLIRWHLLLKLGRYIVTRYLLT